MATQTQTQMENMAKIASTMNFKKKPTLNRPTITENIPKADMEKIASLLKPTKKITIKRKKVLNITADEEPKGNCVSPTLTTIPEEKCEVPIVPETKEISELPSVPETKEISELPSAPETKEISEVPYPRPKIDLEQIKIACEKVGVTNSVWGTYKVKHHKESVMIKVDGVMKWVKAFVFTSYPRNMGASYRDEISFKDYDSCFNKYHFNIFKMKKIRNGKGKNSEGEKTTNEGCKIARRTEKDGHSSVGIPSTHNQSDLRDFMLKNGISRDMVENKITLYEERVKWILHGDWEKEGGKHFADLIVNMKKIEEIVKKGGERPAYIKQTQNSRFNNTFSD